MAGEQSLSQKPSFLDISAYRGLLTTSQVLVARLAGPVGLPGGGSRGVLHYRLYDIDRLIIRTLVYGLLTALLGAIYAAMVLTFGQLFGDVGGSPPSWAVPARPWPWRRCSSRPGATSRRSWTGGSTGANTTPAMTIEAFSARLRYEVDLDTLSAELLAVIDRTVQPTQASLWLRPQPSSCSALESRQTVRTARP